MNFIKKSIFKYLILIFHSFILLGVSKEEFNLEKIEIKAYQNKMPLYNQDGEQSLTNKSKKETKWLKLVYMSADNDLFPFAGRNIKQMQAVGSNDRIKILIHFDMHRPGQKKISKRFFIEKDKIIQIGPDMQMDSGNMNTLIDFFKFATEMFSPTEYEIILDLWNHGTGIIEPTIRKSINPSKLFSYNHTTRLIELNRSVGFLDFISSGQETKKSRGICFDDTTGNYLTNHNLKEALKIITQKIIGKKLAIVCCDACLMSMIECMCPIKDYIEYFVSSQEIELGTGYNYTNVLKPFLLKNLNKEEFAKHIVDAYSEMYGKITHDYTQSAVDLSQINLLQQNINEISKLLIQGLSHQSKNCIKDYIKISRNKNNCTYFDEPSYIDLGHFYQNLINNINKCNLIYPNTTNEFKDNLDQLLKDGLYIINKIVIANTVGKNLKHAKGISIYFPENYIHKSYYDSEFAKNTYWLKFLIEYLQR